MVLLALQNAGYILTTCNKRGATQNDAQQQQQPPEGNKRCHSAIHLFDASKMLDASKKLEDGARFCLRIVQVVRGDSQHAERCRGEG